MEWGSIPLLIAFAYVFGGIMINCLSDPVWYEPADISCPKIGLEHNYAADAEAESYAHAAIWLNQSE